MSYSTHTITPPLLRFQCRRRAPPQPSCAFRRRPRSRRRLGDEKPTSVFDTKRSGLPNPCPDSKLEAVIDLQSLSKRAEVKLRDFLSSAGDACSDIQTLVTVDSNRRVLVSCRRSTVDFAANLVICSFVCGFALWVLGRIGYGIKGLFRRRRGPVMVTRMDRSLGGKEVVVAIEEEVKRRPRASGEGAPAKLGRNLGQVGDRLPKWWPVSVASPATEVDTEKYQILGNRLIRAMIDNKTYGQDIAEDDIIQLRRICRISGIRVSFNTENTRDTFFRTSVDYTLNECSSAQSNSSFVEIDGEDARQFIVGLADNIGLDNFRAARIVSAAVAARTRSRFLQAWALEMQGQHSGMMAELSKICLILRIFPPDESSPEMEMVARGLEKHLKVEQRQYLMDVLAGISDEETRKIAAEALGLMYIPNRLGT